LAINFSYASLCENSNTQVRKLWNKWRVHLFSTYLYTLLRFPLCGPDCLFPILFYIIKMISAFYSFPFFHLTLVNLFTKIPRREKRKSQFVLSLKFIIPLLAYFMILLQSVAGFLFSNYQYQIKHDVKARRKTSCWIESYGSNQFS